ncbi:mucin-4-like isoform X2 [Xenopus laevis]|uniref:Mucin-4-like isoform X2 n=1 Tax=Xenopus laevis TaxID=8355 RepID=A0A8J1LAL1_XENLA|nr:mucin-4-like isoform X2 [Xenopus laevis]
MNLSTIFVLLLLGTTVSETTYTDSEITTEAGSGTTVSETTYTDSEITTEAGSGTTVSETTYTDSEITTEAGSGTTVSETTYTDSEITTEAGSGMPIESTIQPTKKSQVIYRNALLYPYGPGLDFVNLKSDDGASGSIQLSMNISLFGKSFSSLYVDNNGLLSFSAPIYEYTPRNLPAAIGNPFLAPFWADVYNIQGDIYYRQSTDAALLSQTTTDIRRYFHIMNFSAQWVFVATWHKVGYYGSTSGKVNTFQAVLTTDGNHTFVMFNYGDIQWTTGTASGGSSATGLGGTAALAGLNSGNTTGCYVIPGSLSPSIINVSSTSNVGFSGRWAFQVNDLIPDVPNGTIGTTVSATLYTESEITTETHTGTTIPETAFTESHLTTEISTDTITAETMFTETQTGTTVSATLYTESEITTETHTGTTIPETAFTESHLTTEISTDTITAETMFTETQTGTTVSATLYTESEITTETHTGTTIPETAFTESHLTTEISTDTITAETMFTETQTGTTVSATLYTESEITTETHTGTTIPETAFTESHLTTEISTDTITAETMFTETQTGTTVSVTVFTESEIATKTHTGTTIPETAFTESHLTTEISTDTITAETMITETQTGTTVSETVYANNEITTATGSAQSTIQPTTEKSQVIYRNALLYPYGPGLDFVNLKSNDGASGSIQLSMNISLFGKSFSSLYVDKNGLLSFSARINDYTPRNLPTAIGNPFLAPFWADVNKVQGDIYYRQSTDAALLSQTTTDIRRYFHIMNFSALWVFVATWHKVGYYGSTSGKVNTFQAVLTTDGNHTFVLFNYGDIQWTTGTASGGSSATGLGGTAALAGLNSGNTTGCYVIPVSLSPSIINVSSTTNVGFSGRWAFQVNDLIPNVLNGTIALLYPYGYAIDTVTEGLDDRTPYSLNLSTAIPIFGTYYSSLYVNYNGLISFNTPVGLLTPQNLPVFNVAFLAPFWTPVSDYVGGYIFFRLSRDAELVSRATSDIRNYFNTTDFSAQWVLVVTWSRTENITNTVNTFQTILSTDGNVTYLLFNYADINWTTGTDTGGATDIGLKGMSVLAGINSGENTGFYKLPGSFSSGVSSLSSTSNVNFTGCWSFKVDKLFVEVPNGIPGRNIFFLISGFSVLLSGDDCW